MKIPKENLHQLFGLDCQDLLIIIDNTIDNSLLGDLDYTVYPVVQCSQYCENSPIPFVSVDNKTAMKKSVHYLVKFGGFSNLLFCFFTNK